MKRTGKDFEGVVSGGNRTTWAWFHFHSDDFVLNTSFALMTSEPQIPTKIVTLDFSGPSMEVCSGKRRKRRMRTRRPAGTDTNAGIIPAACEEKSLILKAGHSFSVVHV